MFYRLSWNKKDSRKYANTDDAPDTDVPWRMGVRYDGHVPEPLICDLDPDCGDRLPDLFLVDIPLFSNRLTAVLDDCGIKNLQYFKAGVRDAQGTVYENYKAVNIVGAIACVDRERSIALGTAEPPLMDFSRLVIDAAKVGDAEIFRVYESPLYILINERLKNAIEAAQLEGLSIEAIESV